MFARADAGFALVDERVGFEARGREKNKQEGTGDYVAENGFGHGQYWR